MARTPIPTWFFALAVVRHEGRYLLVHERRHGQRWYLPAGRVEPGERFEQTLIRETLEEAGVRVRATGLLRIEHTPGLDHARMRAIFLCEPEGDPTPKSVPDEESLGAAWVSPAELDRLPLRHEEVRELIGWCERGAPVHPLSLLVLEGAPYR